MTKIYKKLVRDKIPQIIMSRGDTAVTRVLTDEEFLECLTKKLAEEVQEFLSDGTVEELTDIYEVILAILQHMNLTIESFEALRKQKLLEKGGFSERIFLDEVIEKDLPETTPD